MARGCSWQKVWIFLVLGILGVGQVEGQFHWTLQNGHPTGIASGPNGFVALARGYNGSSCLYSPDGIAWESTPVVAYSLEQAANGNGIFVVAGQGELWWNADGSKWVRGRSPFGGNSVSCLEFIEGRFILQGSGGEMWTSSEGTNWTHAGTAPASFRSLVFGNGLYVATTHDDRILVSRDLTSWDVRTTGTAGPLAFGNGVFVALESSQSSESSGLVFHSTNGTTWTRKTWSTASPRFHDLVFADGRFVLCGDGGLMAASPDGINWTREDVPTGNALFKLGFSNGRWIAGALRGEMFESTGNGIWTHTRKFPATWVNDLDVVDGRVLALTSSQLWVSTNMWLWEPIAIPGATGLSKMTYAQGKYVFLMGTNVLVSTNLQDWAQAQLPTTNVVADLCYGDGMFVVVGENSTVLTSVDGLTWRLRTRGGLSLRSIVYGDGMYVAVARYGTIISSSDAINWAVRSQSNVEFFSGTYGKGMFVVVGSRSGTIMTSTNGINWQHQNRGSIFYAASFTGRDFFVAGDSGSLLFSQDAKNWTWSPTSPRARIFSYHKGNYIGLTPDINGTDFYLAPRELRLVNPRVRAEGSLDLVIAGGSTNRIAVEQSSDFATWEVAEEVQGRGEEDVAVSLRDGDVKQRKFIRVKLQK